MKNSKLSGKQIVAQGFAGVASAALFVGSVSLSGKMRWWEALLTGILCGTISGTLMRMAKDVGAEDETQD